MIKWTRLQRDPSCETRCKHVSKCGSYVIEKDDGGWIINFLGIYLDFEPTLVAAKVRAELHSRRIPAYREQAN